MTANVISLRGKSTMREVGKAFGLPDDVLDRFSSLFHSGDYPQTVETKQQLKVAGLADDPRLDMLLDTCQQVYALPRHLGQHLGRMEMRILWEELLPRLESFELDGTPTRTKASFVCGPKSVPIRYKMH